MLTRKWASKLRKLEPKDFCMAAYERGDQRCMTGWLRKLLAGRWCGWSWETYEAETNLGEFISGIKHQPVGVISWNDSHTPEERADTWNKWVDVAQKEDSEVGNH